MCGASLVVYRWSSAWEKGVGGVAIITRVGYSSSKHNRALTNVVDAVTEMVAARENSGAGRRADGAARVKVLHQYGAICPSQFVQVGGDGRAVVV